MLARLAAFSFVAMVVLGCGKKNRPGDTESTSVSASPSVPERVASPSTNNTPSKPNEQLPPPSWSALLGGGPVPVWIWGDDSSKPYELRTTFSAASVKFAKLRASGDDQFVLVLNGKEIATSNKWQEGVGVDVSTLLQPDRNELVARVWNTHGPSGLVLKLVMVSGSGEAKYVTSNESWIAASSSADKGKPAKQVAKYGDLPWGREFDFTSEGASPIRPPATIPSPKQPNPPSVATPLPKPADPKPAPPTDDKKWIAEAKREYLAELENKEKRMTAAARRVGALSMIDLELAKEGLKALQQNGIENTLPELADKAALLAPEYVASLRRERVIASEDYPEFVRLGKFPQYHTNEKRKELYAEFAKVTGLKPEWSPTVPFSGLNVREMDLLTKGVPLLKEGGLGRVSKEQRLLLYKAGAMEYVGKQLGY